MTNRTPKKEATCRESSAAVSTPPAARPTVDYMPVPPAEQAKDTPPTVWPDPQPLPAGLPPVLPFDFAMLPQSLHAWVRDVAERMQCPPDYVAATAMIVAGALIGRKVAIRPKRHDDWAVVPNLYGMMVGRPSLLKSPAMKEVINFLIKLEIDAKAEYDAAVSEQAATAVMAKAEKSVTMAKLKDAIKSGDAEAAELARRMAAGDDTPPVRRRFMTNDATVEKLGIILAENPNGVTMFVDELVRLLKTMDRDGHEGDRSFYLTAWSGDSRYTYDRIGRGTLDIDSASVSIVGSIQPGVVADYLCSAVAGGMGDDGMMQRFQLSVWPDASPTWRNVDRYPDADARRRAYDALQRLVDLSPDGVFAERDALAPNALPFLRLEADAQQRFDVWRCDLEQRLRAGREHPAIESHLAKYRSLVPSLALILHLLDENVGTIGDDPVSKAVAWAVYLESHARRLYAGVTRGPAVAARLLAAKIEAGDVPDDFTARTLYRNNWTGLDKVAAGDAIDLLLSLDWLSEREVRTAGRPCTWYAVNPKTRRPAPDALTKPTKGTSVTFVGAA